MKAKIEYWIAESAWKQEWHYVGANKREAVEAAKVHAGLIKRESNRARVYLVALPDGVEFITDENERLHPVNLPRAVAETVRAWSAQIPCKRGAVEIAITPDEFEDDFPHIFA